MYIFINLPIYFSLSLLSPVYLIGALFDTLRLDHACMFNDKTTWAKYFVFAGYVAIISMCIVASELKDPICHSNECQIGSFSSEATVTSVR